MPWARFADDYLANPKLATLSTAAIALDMASIIYSARDLRDGRLTVSDVQAVAALLHLRHWESAAAELVAQRRWTVIVSGWEIHDYLDYQPSRERVLTERAAARDRRKARNPESGQAHAERNGNSGRRSEYVPPDVIDPVPGPGTGVPEYAAAAVRSGPSLAPGRARGSGDLQPLGAVLNGSQRQRRRQQENLSEDEVPDEVRERLNQPPIEEQQP
jgi:hypothetical protein